MRHALLVAMTMVSVLGLGVAAQGASLLLDLDSAWGSTDTNSPAHAAGAVPLVENKWNKLSADSSSLKWGDGTAATGVGFDLGRSTSNGGTIDWNNHNNYQGFNVQTGGNEFNTLLHRSAVRLQNSAGEIGARITGLPAGLYDVYVVTVTHVSPNDVSAVSIGADLTQLTSPTTTGPINTDGTWATPADYVLGQVSLSAGQALTIISDHVGGNYASLNSIAIVPVAEAPIPEPLSALAVMLGAGALAGYLRRRRATGALVALVVAGVLVFAGTAAADTFVTFNDDGSGHNWNTADNWDLDRLPADGEVAVIPQGFTVDVLSDTTGLQALRIGGTLNVQAVLTHKWLSGGPTLDPTGLIVVDYANGGEWQNKHSKNEIEFDSDGTNYGTVKLILASGSTPNTPIPHKKLTDLDEGDLIVDVSNLTVVPTPGDPIVLFNSEDIISDLAFHDVQIVGGSGYVVSYDYDNNDILLSTPGAIPEPLSALAVMLGAGALAGYLRRRRATGALVALVVAGVLVFAGTARAVTWWDGGGDGVSWHDPNNWVGDAGPGGEFGIGGGYTVELTTDAGGMNSWNNEIQGTLIIKNGGYVGVKTLTINGGTLDIDWSTGGSYQPAYKKRLEFDSTNGGTLTMKLPTMASYGGGALISGEYDRTLNFSAATLALDFSTATDVAAGDTYMLFDGADLDGAGDVFGTETITGLPGGLTATVRYVVDDNDIFVDVAGPTVIPEPVSALAVMLGAGALAGYVRRRRA